jgi:hypothetical protein
MNTKEQEARERSEIDYDEYALLTASNYNVDDIDDEVFEKVINDSIYESYLAQLYQDEDDDTWLVDDYQVLESDIKFEIRRRLKLD